MEKLGIRRETLVWSESGSEYTIHDWDGDEDPILRMINAVRDNKNCGVESATGTGKTFTAACIVYWFLACFPDSLVVTVAPKETQLLDQLWKELGGLWGAFHAHFPSAEMITGRIRMRPAEEGKEKWAATAFVCGVGAEEDIAGRAKGYHAEHLLIISEETQSIHPAIIAAFDHTRTADHNLHLALGNPDHQHDSLHRFCFDEHDQLKLNTVHVRISAFDHPNIVTGRDIIPAAIGQRRLKEREEEYGPPNSRMYLSQIRGICPREAEEALIRWEWCEAAAKRFDDPTYRAGSLALGVDVADSPTGDKAAISRWQGACCTEVWADKVENANKVAERVYFEATNPDNPIDPRYVGVDPVGVGASCVNELRRLGLKVRTLWGGQRAVPSLDTDALWSETRLVEGKLKPLGPRVVESERYDNLRSQVWWKLREDLRLGKIALPPDQDLWKDLTTPTFGTPNNKIVVEGKDDIRKRLGHSPDKGDACAYGNWVRRRTPLPTSAPQEQVSREVDQGLERLLERIGKREAARTKQLERSLANKLRQRAKARRKVI